MRCVYVVINVGLSFHILHSNKLSPRDALDKPLHKPHCFLTLQFCHCQNIPNHAKNNCSEESSLANTPENLRSFCSYFDFEER